MTVMNNYLTEKERIIRRGSKIYKKLHAQKSIFSFFPRRDKKIIKLGKRKKRKTVKNNNLTEK